MTVFKHNDRFQEYGRVCPLTFLLQTDLLQ